jgi:hypothetical protein
VVMLAAGGNKRRLPADALHQLEAEHAAIKIKRAIEIGDLEMDMADANAGIDRSVFHVAFCQLALAVILRASGATRSAVMRLRFLRRTWKRKP